MRGFTFIEFLIVLCIILILAAMFLPAFYVVDDNTTNMHPEPYVIEYYISIKANQLRAMKTEYENTRDQAERLALEWAMQEEFHFVNPEDMPVDLRPFLREIQKR